MTPNSPPPLEQSLFITTPNVIHFCSQLSDKTLFECTTPDSIVNARASKDNSGFTSVQAYSVPTAQLLPAPQNHPSPPNVISVSGDGNILLSASPSPPAIYLQDRRWGGSAPVNFHPTDARFPVSCAVFQTYGGSERLSYTCFLLGFQDGTLALYKLFLPPRSRRYEEANYQRSQAFHLQPVKIGAIKKLHKAAMGGLSAAEFIPGHRSRVVSIGHDGRCRLHVSGPATCLSVVSNGIASSKRRKNKTGLLGGDAMEDTEPVYEGSEVLLAIGTQVGKVLIFNVLGLLMREILMNGPVVAVEWVGDMSAPSVLPNRVSSMSPESHPVMTALVEEYEKALNEEECGTVMRVALPTEEVGIRSPYPIGQGRDFFSSNSPPHSISTRVARKPSDVSTGSPLQVERTRERPRRKSFPRPRIATETFRSPSETISSPSLPTSSSSQNATTIKETRKWPQIRQAPDLPPAARVLRFSPSTVDSQSSDGSDSECSDQAFFTPPSTRRDNDKAPQRFTNPRISVAGQKTPTRQISLCRRNTPNTSVYPRPTSRARSREEDKPITKTQHQTPNNLQDASSPLDPKAKSIPHIQPTTRDSSSRTLDNTTDPTPATPPHANATPSPLDSPSSLYSRPTPPLPHRSASRVDGTISIPNPTPEVQGDLGFDVADISPEKRFRVAGRRRAATATLAPAPATLSSHEARKLREDNEVLKRDLEALREEFQALRNVLLSSRIER
ncbi:hypothetical protein P153DRAFT_311176 [Dothidotthia symphoricarpi CBS 119687]|uniref:WD40 repeat-like protein n=1 Tax=Dothidotthia symphoricarpi CBS 119687 TaxID=1392245 RepID=A0A6A6AP83_9PLEO|nr:uncharacterized protein P153DRAFT_311176 [Dothidotthia symphoricarpi CBS 119687]KAF2132311.1 hypothetical protein P153DRAFT_311176 [Dothidotthia symphoricarpi CBS 119687]